ncbi:hypothetical protein BH20VER1_BH20VER1_31660 [soil metagenome]
MIEVEHIAGDQWRVTVRATTRTEHLVRVPEAELQRFQTRAGELLRASFEFLLEREPNTSILREFELPIISRYFPEYDREIGRYLAKNSTEQ